MSGCWGAAEWQRCVEFQLLFGSAEQVLEKHLLDALKDGQLHAH